eukprot:COSAG01_NODE_48493_length_380_cov_12.839858_1_plen_39_part_10
MHAQERLTANHRPRHVAGSSHAAHTEHATRPTHTPCPGA